MCILTHPAVADGFAAMGQALCAPLQRAMMLLARMCSQRSADAGLIAASMGGAELEVAMLATLCS